MNELKWFGWGYADKTYSLDHRPTALPFLRDALDLRGDESFRACDFNAIELRAPRVDVHALQAIAETRSDKLTRMMHAYGRSYRDLVRLRRGEIPNPPDAVVFPANEVQVARVMQYCVENSFALIPFGGGSSVVGGVEPRDERITITLDLARMNRVIALDEISQTATIEAGMFGPDLERALNARGFTLGHFPQSFEFSTLGGWIATRGAGLISTKCGKIEVMTQSVRVVSPRGIVQTCAVPASAAGPSLLQLLIGSEGALGVITQATMRVRELPKQKIYRAWLFKNFAAGVAAIRAILQSDLLPATVRLSDEDETRSFFAMREQSQGWKNLTERASIRVLQSFGYSFTRGALLILGFEGETESARVEASRGFAICRAHHAFDLGQSVARTWLRDRYETPYLRDVLMDRGILVDTVETATTWENLERLHAKLAETISHASGRALVMTHVSHCYRDGASLYVTFLARMARDEEIAQWDRIKRAATECIVANGGTLTHHHGIGYEHAPWLDRENGVPGMDALHALKRALDPGNVMNPGKSFWTTDNR